MRMGRQALKGKTRQRGAVLLLAMVFLLLMAIVAGTVMQTSVLEFFMAGNDLFRVEAFQQAQAITSEIGDDISLAAAETRHLRAVLEHCQWNRSRAARELGIGYNTLLRKMKKYGIEPPD